MAVIDEIEALDISRQFVVRQGVPEMCGAIGKGCLAVKGKQGRAVGAFEPAGRHQQFRQYIIRQSRKTLSHVQFHLQCCVILVSHLDSPRMAVKVPAAHQCLRHPAGSARSMRRAGADNAPPAVQRRYAHHPAYGAPGRRPVARFRRLRQTRHPRFCSRQFGRSVRQALIVEESRCAQIVRDLLWRNSTPPIRQDLSASRVMRYSACQGTPSLSVICTVWMVAAPIRSGFRKVTDAGRYTTG